jgi:hypothetical protein
MGSPVKPRAIIALATSAALLATGMAGCAGASGSGSKGGSATKTLTYGASNQGRRPDLLNRVRALAAASSGQGPDVLNVGTLAVGLRAYANQAQVHWNQVMAASLVISAPVVLVFLALQRYLVQGLTAGAVKSR